MCARRELCATLGLPSRWRVRLTLSNDTFVVAYVAQEEGQQLSLQPASSPVKAPEARIKRHPSLLFLPRGAIFGCLRG